MKILQKTISLIFTFRLLLFFYGFIIAIFIFCLVQDDYESRLFSSISKNIILRSGKAGENVQIIQAEHTVYHLLKRRSEFFTDGPTGGFIDGLIHPISSDLMTAEGACGSYTPILSRVLNCMGFRTRFGQMKVDGKFGGHIIIEVKTKEGWVVLDPLYDLHFSKPDGQLASFTDVSTNWNFYKNQVPAAYNQHYKYDDVCYTNWNKIPIIMPALKKSLSLFMSTDQIEHISLRNFLLRKYLFCGYLLLFLILPLSIFYFVRIIRLKSSARIKKPRIYRSLSILRLYNRANA